MDINNLNSFIEVADRKSFSCTVESLKITQPAVSKRIATFETKLSAKLFDWICRSVYHTEAGQVLLPCARQIIGELSRIEEVINNLGQDINGVLNIGATEHIGTHHLPAVLHAFHEIHSEVDIQLQFGPTDQKFEVA